MNKMNETPLPPLPVLHGARWRHRKSGGLYKVLAVGRIEATLAPCVIYQAEAGGDVWVRPYDEFTDGRFERIVQAWHPKQA